MNKLLETGYSKEAVQALSERFDEPGWLREKRALAFERFTGLDLPHTRYTKARGLKLEDYLPHTPFEGAFDPGRAPAVVQDVLKRKTDADAYSVQVDSSPVRFNVPERLKEQGVVFCDLNAAVREHPELLEKYLMNDLFKLQVKMEALHAAMWSGGAFVYVPRGVKAEVPLHLLFLHERAGAGLFNHILIVAEAESEVTVLEENYALDAGAPALHTAGVEVWVGDGASVQVGGIQNWNEKTFSFGTRRARVGRDARMDWTLGWIGGRLMMSHLSNELAGRGARAHDVQMTFTHGKQHFDVTSNLVHLVPDTTGEVRARSMLRDKSRTVFSGLIRIEEGAQRSNAYQSHRALILDDGARCDASPSLEINADDVRCTHAASASQLDDEKLFYLRSRGLDENQAKKAVVDGFFQPTVDNISMPVARERLEHLIEQKWEGK